jgi:hypothetical protein
MKIRKKPVVIDAIQYTKFNKEEIDSFVGEVLEIPPQEGDWIIKGVSAVFCCKPDIFEMTYEPVPEGE